MGNAQSIKTERSLCVLPDLSLDDCLENLSTGDILLTHASGTFSGGIEFLTQSPWSHVGIVVKDPRYRNGQTLVWETMRREDRLDVIQNRVVPGATLSSLREKIEIYSGSYMAFRKLHCSPRLRSQIESKLPDIIRTYDGVPFDENQLHYALAVDNNRCIPTKIVKMLEDDNEHPRHLFCSRLAAITYKKLGILDLEGKEPIQFIPKDFSSKAIRPLRLLDGCTLGPEFFVKLPHLKAATVENYQPRFISGSGHIVTSQYSDENRASLDLSALGY